MKEERILAIDYGEKRVGLAITDPLKLFAYPLDTFQNDSNLIKKIEEIIKEKNVLTIILGEPVKESGEESRIAEKIRKFREQLSTTTGLDVQLVDERYTSELAKQRIIETVKSKKKRRDKALVDKNAAAIMLEDYLKSI